MAQNPHPWREASGESVPGSDAWAHDAGAGLAKTNVNGGAIAIGHPLGGPSGFMLFKLFDHGAWLEKAGINRKVLRVNSRVTR